MQLHIGSTYITGIKGDTWRGVVSPEDPPSSYRCHKGCASGQLQQGPMERSQGWNALGTSWSAFFILFWLRSI